MNFRSLSSWEPACGHVHSQCDFPSGYVCYVFSENVGKEWRLRTSLARHSDGFARCKSVVCSPCLASGDAGTGAHTPQDSNPELLPSEENITQPAGHLNTAAYDHQESLTFPDITASKRPSWGVG
ncbi:hypothetical protein Bbelb_309040 [Branchiostoma belcheri]|nr:hypothetical protein Bbelb_309040 [Branchiostoma belcheri]